MGVQTQDDLTHYHSSWEYYNEQLMILDLLIEEVIQHKKLTSVPPTKASPGLAISDEEAVLLLRTKLTYLQLSQPYQQLIDRLEGIMESKLKLTIEQQSTSIPISHFTQAFQLDDLDKRAVLVLLAPHINKKYLRLYGFIQDDLSKQFVTLELLIKLCARSTEDITRLYERYSHLQEPYSLIFRHGDLQHIMFHESSLLIRPIQLHEQVIHYLLTSDEAPTFHLKPFKLNYVEHLSDQAEPLFIQRELPDKLKYFVRQHSVHKPIFHICGPTGAGKTLQVKHFAIEMKQSLIEVDFSLLPEQRELFIKQAEQLLLAAMLTESIVVFDKVELEQEEEKMKFALLSEQLDRFNTTICILTTIKKNLPLHTKKPIISLALSMPSRDESVNLWQQCSTEHCQLSKDDALVLADKFSFTCGQIKLTMKHAEQNLSWQHSTMQKLPAKTKIKLVTESAYSIIHHDLHKKAIKLDTQWEWDDLILPHDTLLLLQQACNRIAQRQVVMEEWGFSRLLPYGRGVTMLFTGPPGTGKSMSASVMAKQIGSELYKVDLSTIVSKYIGETEKNLAEIFEQARLSGAILFFDEADALFGKRSEVKDSHDKYANMETSFLLQKMEEYDGLTILATNFAQNLDEAFMRRIHYIVKYPFPDAEQRERLWRSVIPAKLPILDIDFAFLAKTFELSGGPIKNIVLTAAYLAAHNHEAVSMKHMIEAAIQEYKKAGKLLLKDRLGVYSEFWKG